MFHINFNSDLTLVYELNNSVAILPTWKEKIKAMQVDDLCKINHKVCTGKSNLVSYRIARLYELADQLNAAIPNAIIKETLTEDNWQQALNKMHVHFPNIHHNPELSHCQEIATEYNDIIHWLENELRWGNSSRFRIFLDFNKSKPDCTSEIDVKDYQHFTPYINFGDLTLHYCHVGRHAMELFTTKDFECPSEQFIPHSLYSASCTLWFINRVEFDNAAKARMQINWANFYIRRGGESFFKYKITDPALRFGYLKIGRLAIVRQGSHNIKFQTNLEIEHLRNILTSSTVLNWSIAE